MQYYTSIANNKVEINDDDKLYKYRKEVVLPLITCSITEEYFKDPVLLYASGIDGYPYERSAISKWLRTSNVEPINGTLLEGPIKICSFDLLKFIINCLEEKDDHFIFHSPKTNHRIIGDLVKMQKVGFSSSSTFKYGTINGKLDISSSFPIDDYYHFSKNNLFTTVKINEIANDQSVTSKTVILHDFRSFNSNAVTFNKCIFVDCIFPDGFDGLTNDCKFINTLHNFSLEELLTYDTRNSKMILSEQLFSMKDGLITSTTEKYKRSYIPIEKYLAPFLSRISTNMKIKRILNGYDLSHYNHHYFWINSLPKPTDDTITPISHLQKVKNRAMFVKNLIETDETVRKGYEKIQKYIDKKSVIKYSTMDKVKDMQKAMNLPVVYDESISTSGRDCSFLDFSNKSINLDPLKYDSFCFANLNGAKFIYKNFCSTIFFGASLLNTDFGNGSFCSSQGHHPNFNDAKLNVKTYSTIKKEYHDEIMYYL